MRVPFPLRCAAVLLALLAARSARGEEAVAEGEPAGGTADPEGDGDIERLTPEDAPSDAIGQGGEESEGVSDAVARPEHTRSWLSVAGFTSRLASGREDTGAMLVVGLPLERLAARVGGPAERGLPPSTPSTPSTAAAPPRPSLRSAVAPGLARRCVDAAWRASGLGSDDVRLDALAARARASAWLPNLRVRGMRLLTDATHATTLATTDGTTYYAAAGANWLLEVRLTWRLDRLVYTGDEPGLERLRIERHVARSRVAARTLEALVAWWRARADVASALSGSREEMEGRLRIDEAQATLDVLTDGWF
ncbi:MAG: hypothetical protein JOZ69_07420 [Myxococcales bacterium]|nr:hypothetical protein [Myxococcales bacterium]